MRRSHYCCCKWRYSDYSIELHMMCHRLALFIVVVWKYNMIAIQINIMIQLKYYWHVSYFITFDSSWFNLDKVSVQTTLYLPGVTTMRDLQRILRGAFSVDKWIDTFTSSSQKNACLKVPRGVWWDGMIRHIMVDGLFLCSLKLNDTSVSEKWNDWARPLIFSITFL